MRLAYNTSTVVAVLLADGWHDVDAGTFDVGSYEFLSGGQVAYESFAGFEFREVGVLYAGPLDGVRAVKVDRPPQP